METKKKRGHEQSEEQYRARMWKTRRDCGRVEEREQE